MLIFKLFKKIYNLYDVDFIYIIIFRDSLFTWEYKLLIKIVWLKENIGLRFEVNL